MAKQRIVTLPFRSRPGALPGVDVFDLDALGGRAAECGIDLHGPMRAEFHHLVCVRSGSLRITVDGNDHTMRPDTWLWLRPGQVFHIGTGAATGTVCVFQPGFFDRATVSGSPVGPPRPQGPMLPAEGERRALEQTLCLLQDVYARTGVLPLDAQVEIVRHLLSVLVLRLSHLPPHQQARSRGNRVFLAFHQAVENSSATSRRVDEYARALGYSPRTLTRAVLAVTGRTAKQYLNDCTLLEAKRLLVHTDLSAADIARRLGFATPSSFAKFFRQRAGCAPTDFRTQARGAQRVRRVRPTEPGRRQPGAGPPGRASP
ncbi:helix-turn-helix domain-containing protein [Streptomyces celluloflavus]|uniref:helix-turn-helix domain-containing protein n=1 Tax=Streptomyces celluloflavus TaxID=58344 RepID=UPI00345F7C2B|nr:helix-turn-helix transcriptional regulator [Streptomyces celluloflavus]